MKKKIVITTEKRELWVVRELIPEPPGDQTVDIGEAIEVPMPDNDLGEPGEFNQES